MNITLKNVPDSVHEVMKQEAKRKNRSLNAEILQVLATEAAEAMRRHQLAELRLDMDRFAASIPALGSSVPLIRKERQR